MVKRAAFLSLSETSIAAIRMAPRSARSRSAEKRRIKKMCRVDRDLLISKLFYFFFYGAFGSLFPLLAIYFKQLGMNATHAGILVGIRPFVEFISAPLWGGFADRFRKGKALLVFSVACWIAFTSALYFVQPSTSFCLHVYNRTDFVLETTRTRTFNEGASSKEIFVQTRLDKDAAPGLTPEHLHETHNISGYNTTEHGGLVKSPISTRVYKRSDVEKVFFILIVLVVAGEFFSAPAITLADACTLHYLGYSCFPNRKQRMYGSVGWALSMFFIGIALDYGVFSNSDCGQTDFLEKDYVICFVCFAILMTFALIISTQFHFTYDYGLKHESDQKTQSDSLRYNKATVDGVEVKGPTTKVEATESVLVDGNWLASKASVVHPHGAKWISVLKTFATLHYASFLFVIWWFGFGVGLIFCFLFWHLQDIGGSPSIFGIASVINHAAEIVAYFFATNLINAIGHVKVLYVGLLANVARFLYVSWLRDPWFVLPLEVVQGISHAAVWAAATSYIALAAPPSYRSSAQGILQGVHYGLGRACGALFGGIIITYVGSEYMFRGYGIACAVILVGFFAINRALDVEGADTQTPAESEDEDGPHGISMDTLYSTTEVGLTNAASVSPHYGSTDWPHGLVDHREAKVLQ